MKYNRRDFINASLLAGGGILVSGCAESDKNTENIVRQKPIVLSTWNNPKANGAAWKVLSGDGSALDAVEAGAREPEADPEDQSVGYGGRPDRNGVVTLDACIMDHLGNAGSVTYLKDILHPISVARKVMEDTPHVMLSGEGAQQFALENGFSKTNLLTPNSEKEYQEWLKTSEYKPVPNIEMHDTIGILALDKSGNLSGACTTSGLAYKMNGRVGDSPIIGAGLYVDNEVGGATATGMGELVMRSVGSFLVVELMKQGRTPHEACKEAVMRIVKKQDITDLQVGYIALSKSGEIGAYALAEGFVYSVTDRDGFRNVEVSSYK